MINPILASSARRRMRSIRTPLLITVYCALLVALLYFYAFEGFAKSTMTLSQMRRGIEGYTLLVVLQFGLLILVAPAMTAGSIAGERERQTLDLLRVTNTSSFSIAIGKLLESFGFLCLLIFSSLPVLSLILLTGGASFVQMLVAVLFLLLTALAVLSVGLFASSLFKRTVTATVVSYLTVFALGIITILPIFWDVQKIGDIYTAAQNFPTPLTSIEYAPISFITNPALGLFSLLVSQTQMQVGFAGYSHTLMVTFDLLHFERYYVYHMIFLFGFSVVLVLLAAWRVRASKRDKAPRGRRL